jgi:signal transduction histidine kinase
VLLVGAACIVSGASAGFVAGRDPGRRPARLAAILLLGAAWWNLCEVALGLAPDRATALAWMRASAPGWSFVGPLVLHVFLATGDGRRARLRRALPPLYAASLGFLLLGGLTPALVADAVPAPWGWRPRLGPAQPACAAFTIASCLAALPLLARRLREAATASERRQRPWVWPCVATPLCVASLTDVALPLLDVPAPRLGSASFGLLGALGFWIVRRLGHSVSSRGSFADEILATLPEGVALLQASGRIRAANPALARLAGRPREELEALELGALLELPAAGLGGAVELEARLRVASGESIPVAVSTSPVRDRRGHELSLVIAVRDLREVEALRERLVTAARMAAVGELAAGIAHEINNPLAYVRSNLSQLRGHWKTLRGELDAIGAARALGELASDGDALIEESLEGIDRAVEIVRGVRGFSHAGSGERLPTDLNGLLDDVLQMVSSRLRGRVTLECNYVDLPRVRCAPQELKQVFLNLLVNAEQAVRDGGRIRVATARGKGCATALVEDDGCGIPPELIERVFDPFFTTKPVGVGTGLGLGIAYRIVKAHGGEIRLESQPGVGTRVRVRLPVEPV